MSHAPLRTGTADVSLTRSIPLTGAVRGSPAPGTDRRNTALVTGASSGIGAAVARKLSAEGWCLVLNGRDTARLHDIAEQAGQASVFPSDLTRPGAERRLTRFVLQHVDRVDVLVLGAGIGWAGDFSAMPPPVIEEVIEIDLVAPLRLVRQLVPHMVTAGSGHVVLIGSMAGAVGVRGGEAAYSAAKAALGAFADALRYELRGSGVGVSLVVPGAVDTPFFERRGTPYQRSWPRPVSPEHVAEAVWTAVSRGRDEIYVPAWLRLPARIRGAAPALYRRLAAAFG